MATTKSIRAFIREHAAELREAIRRMVPNIRALDEEDLRQWILNDEGLYNWARSDGVRI